MKFLVSVLGASGLLASLVAAAPLEKRAYVIVTETIVETVDATVTVTVTGPAPTAQVVDATTSTSTTPTVKPSPRVYKPKKSSTVTTTSTTSSSSVEAPVPTTTSSTSTPPPPAPEPTTTSTSAPPPPPPEPTTSTSTPPPEPTTTSTTSTPPPPPPTTTSTHPPAAYAPPPSSTTSTTPVVAVAVTTPAPGPVPGTGGKCPAGSPCHGELTHYDTLFELPNAYDACGGKHDGRKEYVVALSHELMGSQSNGNPFCGKYISITYGGVTERAKVVDKCMGCPINNVDASESLFQRFADLGAGRLKGVKWSFTN